MSLQIYRLMVCDWLAKDSWHAERFWSLKMAIITIQAGKKLSFSGDMNLVFCVWFWRQIFGNVSQTKSDHEHFVGVGKWLLG